MKKIKYFTKMDLLCPILIHFKAPPEATYLFYYYFYSLFSFLRHLLFFYSFFFFSFLVLPCLALSCLVFSSLFVNLKISISHLIFSWSFLCLCLCLRLRLCFFFSFLNKFALTSILLNIDELS